MTFAIAPDFSLLPSHLKLTYTEEERKKTFPLSLAGAGEEGKT